MNVKEALDYLLEKFTLERYIYLGSTIISTLALFFLVGYNFYKGADIVNIISLFGPSGVIAYSGSRILKMWNDCITLITKVVENGN